VLRAGRGDHRAVQAPDRRRCWAAGRLGALPDLRTIRPKLAAIADRTDPVAVQRLFASAMLAADPVLSGVY
jgi:hypothetical protein